MEISSEIFVKNPRAANFEGFTNDVKVKLHFSFCCILEVFKCVVSPFKQMSVSFNTKEKAEGPECIALPKQNNKHFIF